jgi:hypothetical protein
MNYTIYRLQTGAVELTVSCPEECVELQFDAATHGYIAGYIDATAFYIEAGRPVAMPSRPSEYHVFDYTTKQWVDPRTPETEWPIVRARRNQLLQASDWTQLPDVPLATKEAWAVYRQALRDITEQPDPFNIVWPTPPN